jgi:hypothetical protein
VSIIIEMTDERWTRADWARWFVYHDEVEEAARVLEPGDELALGKSDALDLAEALSRRGLTASHETGRLVVRAGDATARKPPLRATSVETALAKKTA